MRFGQRNDLGHRRRLAVQVHRHQRARPRTDRIAELPLVDEERLRIHVDQDGFGADQVDGADGRVERVRLRDDLVARPDAQGPQGDHQRVGTGVDAPDVSRAEKFRELRFELLHFGCQLVPTADQHRPQVRDQRLDVRSELMRIIVAADLHTHPSRTIPAIPAPISPDKSSFTPNSTRESQPPGASQQRASAARATSCR